MARPAWSGSPAIVAKASAFGTTTAADVTPATTSAVSHSLRYPGSQSSTGHFALVFASAILDLPLAPTRGADPCRCQRSGISRGVCLFVRSILAPGMISES